MRFIPSLTVTAAFLFSLAVGAQPVSKDSISSLKQSKERIELEQNINDQKLKLASMENTVAAKQKDLDDDKQRAQKATDENAAIAAKLADNTSDKSLARKARKSSKSASRAVNDAKDAEDKFSKFQHSIEDLRSKIESDQNKLNAMPSDNN